ncbi:hypothetical protein WA026_011554 [Henosepilachna vigintioctopunctata]|uniref:small monomeric GTPase n=1 Tax=Henosepilachna vigintioctopunctata TaxID=420089 RepID=A0AAW1TSF1_9CUCU
MHGITKNILDISKSIVFSKKVCLGCLLVGASVSYFSIRGRNCSTILTSKPEEDELLHQEFHLNEVTFKYTFHEANKMRRTVRDVFSPTIWVGDLPWKIMLRPTKLCLECYVICSEIYCSWSCCVNLEFSLLGKTTKSMVAYHELYEAETQNDYNRSLGCIIPWEELLDPGNEYIQEDSITFQVSLKVEVLEKISWEDRRYLSDPRASSLVRKYKTDVDILHKRIEQMNKRNMLLENELKLMRMYKNQHFFFDTSTEWSRAKLNSRSKTIRNSFRFFYIKDFSSCCSLSDDSSVYLFTIRHVFEVENNRKMNVTSPKSSLAKLGFHPRQKSLKVMILGQGGVGKTAMVVRFITRRYIGDYDPSLEKIYTYHTVIDNEMVYFDILDTAGQPHENECLALEANIRWAEAFILMYSVTDKCSFDECYRLKFLINYNKRRRRLGSVVRDGIGDVPVLLVGNKIDQVEDRMVSSEEGQKRSKEIGCVCFHEISVRESIDQVWSVFRDICRFWRVHNKNPIRLRRSGSEKDQNSPDKTRHFPHVVSPSGILPNFCRGGILGRRWTEGELEEQDESVENADSIAMSPPESAPFRERACTDGNLHLGRCKPWKWRYPPTTHSNSSSSSSGELYSSRNDRRMSISMRGNNASY